MLLCLASLLLALPQGDSAPLRPLSQWIHDRWAAKDGAPREITGLAQTTDGYLWVSSWGRGVFRFDGVRFVPVPLVDGDSILHGGSRLSAAPDGSLWLVLPRGRVGRLKDGVLSAWGEPEGVPRAYDVTLSSRGAVVVATSGGVFQFLDGKWKSMNREWGFPGSQSRRVWFDPHDGLWASADDRPVYRSASGGSFRSAGFAYTSPLGPAPFFAEDAAGRVWVSDLARSVHTIPIVDAGRPMTEFIGRSNHVLVDRKGSLWIGTTGAGVRRVMRPDRMLGRKVPMDGSEVESFSSKDGLLSDVITLMLEDREGNIWVATDRGLDRFRETTFVPLGASVSARPRVVFATRDSSLWVAPLGISGLDRVQPPHRQSTVMLSFHPRLLVQNRAGTIWSTDADSIYRLDGPSLKPFRIPHGNLRLSDLAVDRDGRLWAYDEKSGLLRQDHDRLTLVAGVRDSVYAHASLFSDSKGAIWMAFFNRMVRYDAGKLTTFRDDSTGFPSEVWTFLEDRTGTIWVGGQSGLGRFEGDHFSVLTRLPGTNVLSLVADESGAFWIANREGVLRLPPGEAGRALADSSYRIQYRRFDRTDGLPGEMNASLFGPVLTRTADGTIWVATDSGVAGIDPRRLPPVASAPALIEAVRVDGRELRPAANLTIPPNPGDLEIDYTAATLSISERVRFRYQLVGEDAGWRDVGSRRRAYYTGLTPGNYTFRVITSAGNDVWQEQGASLAFRVQPAWYQTLWFKALAVCFTVGFGACVAALIQRSRHHRVQEALTTQFRATLAERTRIAQDLHDSLLQGFAGVTLQLKAVEREIPANPEGAVQTVLQVQRLAVESMREARARVWDMHTTTLADHDLPAALEVMAQERTAGSDIEARVTTSGKRRRLSAIIEDCAFRVGREAVSNASLHAAPRSIEIEIVFEDSTLILEVRDDGRGFTVEEGEAAHRNGHFGLSGMRERALQAGGNCSVGPWSDGGTVVHLELPLTSQR